MNKVLITGTTSGLGLGLKNIYERNGYQVDSINRDTVDLEDLRELDNLIDSIINSNKYRYVFLNAGILGELNKTTEISIHQYNSAFNINVWSNKLIIDSIIRNQASKNIICISSGVSNNKPYYGWSIYCSTKAAIRQILACYQLENPEINFLSLAPGLVRTKMQETICEYDENIIPSVTKFKEAYETMMFPDECALKVFSHIQEILNKKIDYFDLRDIK